MNELFVFVADIHLRKNVWKKHPELEGDAWQALLAAVNYCNSHNLPLVMGGDIFDKMRPDPETVSGFSFLMNVMRDHNTEVFFIQGNHDGASHPWPTAVSDWPKHLDGQYHSFGNVLGNITTYSLDFKTVDQLGDALGAMKHQVDILITHQAWAEIQTIGNTDGSLKSVTKADIVLTGDYHKADTWNVTREDGTMVTAWSPGSMCMQSLVEDPQKSFLVIGRDEAINNVAFKRQPYITRPFYSFDVATLADLNGFCDQNFDRMVPDLSTNCPYYNVAAISKPILRVRYKDDINDALSRIQTAVGDRFHLFDDAQHVIEETEVDFEAAPDGSFETLVDAYQRLAPSDDIYNKTVRVLRAEDRGAELTMIREEFMNARRQNRAAGVVPAPTPGD